MRRWLLLLSLISAACTRTPEAQVAQQTTVEIPAVPEDTKPEASKERRDVPVPSSLDRADSSTRPPEDTESESDEPPTLPPSWTRAAAGPTGGPACDKLADCCLKAIHVASGAPDPAVCDQMRKMPAMICAQLLPQLVREAAKHGVTCRP
jgi:hypothetical protein